MSELSEDGTPFYFAMRRPPTAAAMDDDICLTVTAGVPTSPEQVESIDIIFSTGFAAHAIAQLTQAVEAATGNQARHAQPRESS